MGIKRNIIIVMVLAMLMCVFIYNCPVYADGARSIVITNYKEMMKFLNGEYSEEYYSGNYYFELIPNDDFGWPEDKTSISLILRKQR